MRTLLVVFVLALATATAGCSRAADPSAEPAAQVATVSVDELDRMLAGNDCQAVDANGNATRRKLGIIPGAVLLPSMDAIDNLPADKSRQLVFYCANTACTASHHAASKAMAAGYTRVKVLPEGIAGWIKAGKPTASI